MRRFTAITVALAAASLSTACTESVQRVRPIPIESSAPAQAGNRAPTIQSVAIQPVEPGPGDALACIAWASDAEGDAIDFEYRWRIDGAPAGVGDTLVGPFFRGQSVTCTATPRDAAGLGRAAQSAPWVFAPAPKAVARVTLDPARATDQTPLRCGVVGDPSAAEIGWYINDALLSDATGAGLPAGRAAPGDRVRCQVRLDGLVIDSNARTIGRDGGQFAQLTSLPSAP